MTMGRPPKPTHLKLVAGNPGKRRLNRNEPQPQRGVPPMPRSLNKQAQKLWPEVCNILDGMGVLTAADGWALASLCEAYSDLVAARKALEARGSTYAVETMTGVIRRVSPEAKLVSDADRRVRTWLAAFGMTPSDRARVRVDVERKDEAVAKYLA
jgi:P27 family predicted phage terminase small subunit